MRQEKSFRRCSFAPLLLILAGTLSLSAAELDFRRGDTNGDGGLDLSDGVATLNHLFLGGFAVSCLDAADADDSGTLDLSDSVYTFSFLFTGGPAPLAPGHRNCGADPTPDGLGCDVSDLCVETPPDTDLRRAGHVLNRIAYGPSPQDLERVRTIGVQAYIEEQLEPEGIDESDNAALRQREEALFEEKRPARDTKVISAGDLWRYRKGTSEPSTPSTAWSGLGFDDSGWLLGPTGIGYGDGDDATVLGDMRRVADDPLTPENEGRPGYLSVYMRTVFRVSDPATVDNLILRIDYDDGFVAHLNGTRVASGNMSAGTPAYNTPASGSHEAGTAEEFDISARRNLLQAGDNVLAIEVHNRALDSSDLSMIPELVSREYLPGDPVQVIGGIGDLQALLHVRGIYSRKQLQAVLAEFWENHFTTDFDKVAEYFDNLQNSDATDAMSEAQARAEAAQVEYLEYQFFYENALGNFGDLLLFSASSPSMLIYLDNVLSFKGEPNENYPREIFELSAFGVNNRYTQRDIEELARAFTGWTVCKVLPEDVQSFPDSALNPPADCGVQFSDAPLLGSPQSNFRIAGAKYFKGRAEPSPGPGGEPTLEWTLPGFDDGAWLDGTTPIGYGDGDDDTVLGDMRGDAGYLSVYVRHRFDLGDIGVEDPLDDIENFIFAVEYDDGFVAYLNGVEIARSETMMEKGSPPAFDEDAEDTHEVDEGVEYFNLNSHRALLQPQGNVLAIQVHNGNLSSSDLSMIPRLMNRTILPGSVENGDPSGVWVFRFHPDDHDTGAKTIYQGTPYRIDIPAGRTGPEGVRDALDVVEAMAGHPSTAEFISIKLIQRFVSDEITLSSFKDGTAPIELRALLADAIAAWFSTDPPGNIETVMRTLLDPENRSNTFWADMAYRSKVKTPIEFINSTIRVLDGVTSGVDLPEVNDELGMHLVTRDEPDGWSELGFDWIDTATMLNRMTFAQRLAENRNGDYAWSTLPFLDSRALDSSDAIVDFFDELMFQGTLPSANRALLEEYLDTDINGNPLILNRARSDFQSRVEEFMGLMLSMPQWQFQ